MAIIDLNRITVHITVHIYIHITIHVHIHDHNQNYNYRFFCDMEQDHVPTQTVDLTTSTPPRSTAPPTCPNAPIHLPNNNGARVWPHRVIPFSLDVPPSTGKLSYSTRRVTTNNARTAPYTFQPAHYNNLALIEIFDGVWHYFEFPKSFCKRSIYQILHDLTPTTPLATPSSFPVDGTMEYLPMKAWLRDSRANPDTHLRPLEMFVNFLLDYHEASGVINQIDMDSLIEQHTGLFKLFPMLTPLDGQFTPETLRMIRQFTFVYPNEAIGNYENYGKRFD
jgi:hypothetical protein